MYAARYGRTDVVKLLRNAGANTEIEDKAGCKPIDYAAKYGHADVEKMLRNPGGNTEIKDKTGCKAKRMDLLRPTLSQGVIKATIGRESLETTEDRAPRNLSTFNFKLPQTESSEGLSKAVAECESIETTDNTGTGHLSITGFTLVSTDSADSCYNSTSQMANDVS